MSEEFTQTLASFVLELVQIKSVNGQDLDGETAVATRIHKEATKLGLESQLLGKDPRRQNVVVTANIDILVNASSPLASKSEPIGLMLFVGHMDTVAVGDNWTTPPFGKIYPNKIYGRGTSDNKAGIVCALYALSELQNSDALDLRTNTDEPAVEKKAKAVLAGVVDEESGAQSTLGLNYLLSEHLEIVKCYGAIYTYLNQTVTIGHRGLQRYIVEVSGESVHSGSERWNNDTEGANAVAALSEIVLAIEREKWPEDRNENFGELTLKVTPGTVFNGGSFESIVPSKAQMIIDCRTMPSTDILRLENRIQDIVQQIIDRRNSEINTIIDGRKSNTKKDKLHATVTNKNNLPAVVIPQGRDHPLARACVGALTKNGHSAETIKIQACGPANESYMLMTKDIPTICGFGPVGGNPHGADEFVEISSLAETVQIYQQVVIGYIKNLQCK